MTKNTYGTGSFVLTNVGCDAARTGRRTAHDDRVVARARRATYAMEGAIFVTGAAVQWLRDGLGIIARRRRDRSARRVGARHRRRLRRARVHRPRLAVVGPVRPRHDRRHHAVARRARTSPAPWSRRWRSRPPTSSMRSRAASGTRAGGDARRRRRVGDGPAVPVPGRPARRAGAPGRDPGDDRARRRVPRRSRRRRVGLRRRR